MIELKRILHPTDFSQNSKFALDYACAFAEKFNAELHILYVLQDILVTVPDPVIVAELAANYDERVRGSAEQALLQLPDPAWARGRSVIRATCKGSPFTEIVRYAGENKIDLIVLGTHGRSGLAHVVLGSVAEHVVRKAGCPVLTVRPPEQKLEKP